MDSKKQNWWPFVLGLFCGGTVVAFSLGSSASSGESRTTLVVADANLSAHEIGATSSDADFLPAATHVPITKPDRVPIAKVETPEPVGMIEQLHVEMPTDEQLEKRYANYSLIELNGALKGLGHVLHQEAQAFIAKKMERGIYTTQILPLGVEVERPLSYPDGSPRAVCERWLTRPDGFAEVWIGELHPKEQPLIEARYKEIYWVGLRISSLKKAEKLAQALAEQEQ